MREGCCDQRQAGDQHTLFDSAIQWLHNVHLVCSGFDATARSKHAKCSGRFTAVYTGFGVVLATECTFEATAGNFSDAAVSLT